MVRFLLGRVQSSSEDLLLLFSVPRPGRLTGATVAEEQLALGNLLIRTVALHLEGNDLVPLQLRSEVARWHLANDDQVLLDRTKMVGRVIVTDEFTLELVIRKPNVRKGIDDRIELTLEL